VRGAAGDDAQLYVTRHGCLIAYCASHADLPGLGVNMSRMATVAECSAFRVRLVPARLSQRRPAL
jgi:hypothetical protein